MNLLVVRLMFWQNKTLNPGTLVEVHDRGLMAAMIGSGRAVAADPETQREYERIFEPATATARAGAMPARTYWRR